MTEEIKQENCKRETWTISPDFGKFLLTILASFLGCLIALCLYSAAVKPSFKPCNVPPPPRFEAPMHHRGEFRPDCPYKKHKMHAQGPEKNKINKPDKKAPEVKNDKK